MTALGHTETEIFMLHGPLMGSAAVQSSSVKLGLGIVQGSGSGHSPVAEPRQLPPAARTVATAAVQRAGRPAPGSLATAQGLLYMMRASIIQELEGKEGHCQQEVRDAAQLMQTLDTIVSSAATRAGRAARGAVTCASCL